MSNQTNQTKENTNSSRRRAVQIALSSAPVIATLTSRPVHAVQGLSNMLSGDASVCRGDNRYGGMSPGFWMTPDGTTSAPHSGIHVQDAWNIVFYGISRTDPDKSSPAYGTLIPKANGQAFGEPTVNDYEGGEIVPELSPLPLREALAGGMGNGSEPFHLIAGYLNARFFDRMSGAGNTQYIFSEADFWDLFYGRKPVPDAYYSLTDLISQNYYGKPGDACVISSEDPYFQ